MFVFDSEKCNVEKFAEGYATGFYDVGRLGDRTGRDLTLDETDTERENIYVFDGSN